MIAAKAASRKPMATSPTRKDFPTSSVGGGGPVERDARLIRSSTMGRDGSISDARYNVEKNELVPGVPCICTCVWYGLMYSEREDVLSQQLHFFTLLHVVCGFQGFI